MSDQEWVERICNASFEQRAAILEEAWRQSPKLYQRLLQRLAELKIDIPNRPPTEVENETTELIPRQSKEPLEDDLQETLASDDSNRSKHPKEEFFNQDNQRSLLIAERYRLQKKIGQGGMGSVWIAEQIEPVRRQVAIKLIRAGTESAQIVKRFQQERQALAIMDHPGIARVLDGGTMDDGQPWFAMELVDGIPLTDYCDQQRLSINDRLELFIEICQAVQHAHQKGVIHRDLKPGNILVTTVNGRPAPKVIDFGLACGVETPLVDESIGDAGAIVGTPIYMSPEQADPGAIDIDTRADVYALGIILYELLVGAPPISAKEFQQAGILEMLRMVREVDPPRPSTRLSSLDNLPGVAAQRAMEPGQLQRWLSGDIEWITMKALEKERDRRYETPTGLAADLRRYLQHEPVLARPPSRAYKLRKFVRRNRVVVAAGAMVALALIGGLAGTTWGLIEARRQSQRAQQATVRERERAEGERQAKILAEKAAESERAANELTQLRLLQIQAGSQLVFDIFRDLDVRRARIDGEPIEAVLARRLSVAGEKIDDQLVGDPLTTADLLHQLGTSLLSLGYPEQAILLFERATELREEKLGSDDRETIASQLNLAEAFDGVGKVREAAALKESIWQSLLELRGPEHPDTLMAAANRAVSLLQIGHPNQALDLFQQVYETRQRVLGDDHFDTLTSINNLSYCLLQLGRYQDAKAMIDEGLPLMEKTLGATHHDTLLASANLIATLDKLDQQQEALQIAEDKLPQAQSALGRDHPTSLTLLRSTATLNWKNHQRLKALEMIEQAYQWSVDRYGANHPMAMQSMDVWLSFIAQTRNVTQFLERAEQLVHESQQTLGASHPDTVSRKKTLASFLSTLDRHDEAISIFEEVLEHHRELYGDDHPLALVVMNDLAGSFSQAERFQEAGELLEKALDLKRKRYGDRHPETLTGINNLAVWYRSVGLMDRSIPLYEELLTATREQAGETSEQALAGTYNLAVACLLAGEKDKAKELFEDFRTNWRKSPSPNMGLLADLQFIFARRFFMIDDFDTPAAWLTECIELFEEYDRDGWKRAAAQTMLGRSKLEGEEWEQAEELMLTGHEGLMAKKSDLGADDVSLIRESIGWLIDFYQKNENQTEQENWEQRLKSLDD